MHRLVRQLGSGAADLEETNMGGMRACLTRVLLAFARARRLDDAFDSLEVAARLGLRMDAGALQARGHAPLVALGSV